MAAATSWTLVRTTSSLLQPSSNGSEALRDRLCHLCFFQASTDLEQRNCGRGRKGKQRSGGGKKGRELIVAQEEQKATEREEKHSL